MDWKKAIEMNRAALIRIVAGLLQLLEVRAARLPLPVYDMIVRVLYPAESAVRRLIVVASRGLDVSALSSRPMPKGLVIVGKGRGRISFQLFDTRKTFFEPEDIEALRAGPYNRSGIRMIDEASPRAHFLALFAKPVDGYCSEAETLNISTRINILQRALDHLPREAKRMARWLKRRETLKDPKFMSPLRPGPPPGYRSRPREDIDRVLTECHGLAWEALRLNST